MNSEQTLKIKIPEHYNIVYETTEDFEKSPFSEAYKKAHQFITEIVNKQEELSKENESEVYNSNLDSYNNIIAFTGERGMGKSSTMINFVNSLNDEKSPLVSTPRLGKVKFIKLDAIDPSLFRGDESIFEIVLAQMFRKFKSVLDEQILQKNDEERRKLIFSFQKVYDTFRWTKKDNKEVYSEESIDNLIHLAKGSNLKSSFNSLIISFLKFTGGKGNNKLVITIDDFDLKTNGIKEMLEDIRQLLINNNIIILIAYKEDQLRDLLQRSFSKEIENISSRYLRLEKKAIEIQVDKYLEKLLPNGHQIELLSSTHKEISSYLQKVIQLSPDNGLNKNETNYRQADKRLLAASYIKQNLFIMLEDFSTSFLYRPNLRSLNELLISLDNNSIDLFTQYVQNLHYTKQHEKWVESLWTCEPELINKITLDYLSFKFERYLKFSSIHGEGKKAYEHFKNITTTTNYHLIQFGDIVAITKIVQNRVEVVNEQEFRTLQFIKLCYNLRRLELIKTNINYINNSSLSGIISPVLLNTYDRINREDITGVYRDHFAVITSLHAYLVNPSTKTVNIEHPKYQVLSALIESINKDPLKENLHSQENIYRLNLTEIEEKTKNFTVNIFKPLNKISTETLGSINCSDLKPENEFDTKYFYLFQNIDFVLEFYEIFINQLNLFSKNKKISLSTEKYSRILYILYTKGIEHTFMELNEKYASLGLNFNQYTNSSVFLKEISKIYHQGFDENVDEIYEVSSIIDDIFRNQTGVSSSEITKLEDINSLTDVESIKSILEYLDSGRVRTDKLQGLFEGVEDQDVKKLLFKDDFIKTLTNKNSKYQQNREKLKSDLQSLIDRQENI